MSTTTVEGMNHGELCGEGRRLLDLLQRRLETRRGRESAMEAATDVFLVVAEIAKRLGVTEFLTRAPVEEETDEDDELERAPAGVSLAELMRGGPGSGDGDEAEEDDEAALRLTHFRVFLDYLVLGCRHEQDVTRKVLAIVRRVRPDALATLGLSQADVARKLGERRATVSAREKRLVEAPLRLSGARGILSNGARGAATSAACARSARGNSNRRKATFDQTNHTTTPL